MHLLISASTFSMALKSSFMVMPYSSLPGIGPAEAVGLAPQAVRKRLKKMINNNGLVLRMDEPISNKFCSLIVFLLGCVCNISDFALKSLVYETLRFAQRVIDLICIETLIKNSAQFMLYPLLPWAVAPWPGN